MIIAGSSIAMSGRHHYTETHKVEESLKVWVGDRRPDFEGNNLATSSPSTPRIDPSTLPKTGIVQNQRDMSEEDFEASLTPKDRVALKVAEILMKNLTGKDEKIRLARIKTSPSTLPNVPTDSANPQREGWGLEYDRNEFRMEQENTSFETQGIVRTADGREICIDVRVNLSREFIEQHNISLRLGDARLVDPLVINFDGNAASLTDTKFEFDLTSNGTKDMISFVNPGSGFLALDKNGNGIIDNGGELFGPVTGNGFAELAKYDIDNNLWIDEADPVFNDLRIWTKDSEGRDYLYTLKEKNIGAIYLGNVSTPFAYKDFNNQLHGSLNSMGIFLAENGAAGTIQQIDLAV
jgi:hypothetical protein